MRITNNAIVRNYNRQLNSNLSLLNQYSTRVQTQRKFMSMNEDTSAGIRALQLRRSMENVASYSDTAQTALSQLTAAESQMMQVAGIGQDIATRYINALNGTMSESDREIFANEVDALMKQILTCANGQFADRFQFGGTNTTTAPFEVMYDANDPKKIVGLTYQGVNVADMADAYGNMKPEYQYLLDDAVFVDIGLGLAFDGSDMVQSSAFKVSQNGLEFLGIGDKNLYLICNEISNALRDPNFQNSGYYAELLNRVTDAYNGVTLKITDIGADTNYLQYSIDRLRDDMINLIERQDAIEFIDPAEEIMNWKMQEFVYNAALQMGQRLLQPTLFNFIS